MKYRLTNQYVMKAKIFVSPDNFEKKKWKYSQGKQHRSLKISLIPEDS